VKWQTEDAEALLHYNALDVCATSRVYRAILAEEDWTSPRVQRLHKVHQDLSVLAGELHSTGFLQDQERRDWLSACLIGLAVDRMEVLKEHVSKRHSPAFEGKDDDMRALLYGRHAKDGIRCYDIPEPETWDDVMWTNEEKTTLAVDKEALLRIFVNPATDEEAKTAIQLFWRAKAPKKANSTWVSKTNSKGEPSEVQQMVGTDNRMRADWNSAGTETMRWASPLMTLPEQKDDESLGGQLPNIRWMYVATPGWKLYHWDWSQQELRMLYAVSGDEHLGNALRQGDVYTYDAHQWFPAQLERLFGKDWRTVSLKKQWPNGRRQCKVGHLAAQYMAGAPAMWTQALVQDRTIKFSTMKAIRELFHRDYHVTVQYAKDEERKAASLGYSEGLLLHGRRYYPAPPPITEACNYPVQRTAGEMGALTMLGIAKALKKYKLKARILTNEHDALTLECHDDPATCRAVDEICTSIANGPWTIKGRKHEFPAKGKFAYDWAEACAD
jgi:hypothetical protein